MRVQVVSHSVVTAALLCLSVCGVSASESRGQADGPEALLERVNEPELESARAVRVENVKIEMGPGELVLGSGILVPGEQILGRALELVFVGDARFRMDPRDEIESAQLELFAGAAPLTTPVTHAVLVVGNSTITEHLLDKPDKVPESDKDLEEAIDLFREWVQGPQRDGFGAPAAMVKSLAGEPGAEGYFAVWCRSPDLGEFFYSVDPFRVEQVELGQFVPVDLSGYDVWTRDRIRAAIKRQKWFGRFSGFKLEELGEWDTWVAMSLQSEQGIETPGSSGFEAEHYMLDLIVDPRYELDAWGKATVRLRAVADSRRSVDLSIYAGLKITGVFGAEEQPLHWIGSGGSFSVFLPEPVPKGQVVELRVEYEGDLIQKSYGGPSSRDESFRLLTTRMWYPHAGSVDRATYDVTLHWPKKYEVVGSGRVVDKGQDGGLEWERRTLDVPAIAFTFELGRFEYVQETMGHVDLTFAFADHGRPLPAEARQKIVETAKSALAFFEERFGPYPLDYLTVVPVKRSFSQGFLSIVTLAEAAMLDPRPDRRRVDSKERRDEIRDLTIAHEISHQWWGNWVGWDSYRDQWLSEALAEFSSLMYGAVNVESKARFLARNAIDWRDSLLAHAAGGRTVESLGPVVLGHRVGSSMAPDAYQAIIYDKGSVVVRMLARDLGEEPFAAMLGELAKAVGNRVIDTDTFFRAMERMSGFDLQPFVRRFVRGTGVPEVYYSYSVREAEEEGKWVVRGEAHQVSRGQDHHSIERTTDDNWQLRTDHTQKLDVESSSLVVPFQLILTPPDEVARGKNSGVQSARGFGGRLVIEGSSSEFEFEIPERPEKMALDQFGEVLATFQDEGMQPKQALQQRASRLADGGDLDGAEIVLREALNTPLYSERGLAWLFAGKVPDEVDLVESRSREDSWIHAMLARIQIETGRYDEAQKELLESEELVEDLKRGWGWNERRILWSRLDLSRGDYEQAFRRLKEKSNRWLLGAEGYAILAVAAYETGRDQLVADLIEYAEYRGADMSDLKAVRDSRSDA